MKKGLIKFLAKKRHFPLIYKADTRRFSLFYQQYLPILSVILGIVFGGTINYYFDQISEEFASIDEDIIYYSAAASASSLRLESFEGGKTSAKIESDSKNKWKKILPAPHDDSLVRARKRSSFWNAILQECRNRMENCIKKMCDNWLGILVARYFYLKRQLDKGW